MNCFELFPLEERNYLINHVHLQRITKSSFWEHSMNQIAGDNLSSHISQYFPRIPFLRGISSLSSGSFYFFVSMTFWLFLWLYLSFLRWFAHRHVNICFLAPKKLLTLQCLSNLVFQWNNNFLMFLVQNRSSNSLLNLSWIKSDCQLYRTNPLSQIKPYVLSEGELFL